MFCHVTGTPINSDFTEFFRNVCGIWSKGFSALAGINLSSAFIPWDSPRQTRTYRHLVTSLAFSFCPFWSAWFLEDVVEDLCLGRHYDLRVSKSLFLFLLMPSPCLQPDSLTSPASRCYPSLCPAYLFLQVMSGSLGAGGTPVCRGIPFLSENSSSMW